MPGKFDTEIAGVLLCLLYHDQQGCEIAAIFSNLNFCFTELANYPQLFGK
ncbi:MAG: hypothetical protein IPG64_14260 [Haliea sp.]|nr:hypothetical protein [Haliea sp.]